MTVAAKRERRDMPTYGPLEAARCLALPASTVRVWSVGLPYRKGDRQRFMQPVIEPARRSPLALSFWNVVELYVLATIRRRHEVSMHKVRHALACVREEMGKQRPLIDEEFLTDGVSLFVERYGHLINASASGQKAMQVVCASRWTVSNGTNADSRCASSPGYASRRPSRAPSRSTRFARPAGS